MLRWLCTTALCLPLLSCVCGNATPGAPVIASMSGRLVCNQGGTVEYE